MLNHEKYVISHLIFPGGISNGHHTQDSTEIQRLRRELREEQERVQRLSAQLTTNVREYTTL